MLIFVAALVLVSCASGVWCAIESRRSGDATVPFSATAVLVAVCLIVAVTTAAAFLRISFVPPHHAMYVDEPWYAEAACNLARTGRLVLCETTWSGERCEPYEKAPGWPVVLALWAWLNGCATSVGIDVNRVLGTLTVPLLAIVTRCAGGSWWQAIFAAAILAMHPVHVAWSATGETNVPAAFAALAGMCGALLYLRTARPGAAVLAVSALGLATVIRPETLLFAAVIAGFLAVAARAPRRERMFTGVAIVTVATVSFFSSLDLWAMNESISDGAFLSARSFVENLRFLGGQTARTHAVVALLGLAGGGVLLHAGKREVAHLLWVGTCAAAVPVLAYDRFAERMVLVAIVAALPLAGFVFGVPVVDTGHRRAIDFRVFAAVALFAGIALLWREPLAATADPPATQMLETRVATRVGSTSLPSDALVISAQPSVLAATGMTNVMAIEEALKNAPTLTRAIDTGKPVYFFCDMFCEENFGGAGADPPCDEILKEFALAPVVEERLPGRAYALYRITGRGSGSSPPDCPRPRRGT